MEQRAIGVTVVIEQRQPALATWSAASEHNSDSDTVGITRSCAVVGFDFCVMIAP
jgi:hypothetical protein